MKWNARVVLVLYGLLVVLALCQAHEPPIPAVVPATMATSRTTVDARRPSRLTGRLFNATLELEQVREQDLDHTRVRARYQALLQKAREGIHGLDDPREIIDVLCTLCLHPDTTSYRSNKTWRDGTMSGVLLRGEGNCAATSTLMTVLAHDLGLPLHMVLSPQHAYVRWEDRKARINIETTSGGREIPDHIYLEEAGAIDEATRAWARWNKSLSADEFLAEQCMWAAGHAAGRGQDPVVTRLHDRADSLVPGRSNRHLERLHHEVRLSGDRQRIITQVRERLREPERPRADKANLLMMLAREAAGQGDHHAETHWFRLAFRLANRQQMKAVLTGLAFSYRAHRDFRAAVTAMDLAVLLEDPSSPALAGLLYNLAILQKNDGRIHRALDTIAQAQKINPESWNLRFLEAGYRVLSGDRAGGLQVFRDTPAPRDELGFHRNMVAWFWAVWGDREKFYPALSDALEQARDPGILDWIDEDVDLDPYRGEARFRSLLEQHTPRLLGTLEDRRESK